MGIRADGSRVLSSESLFMVCASRASEQCQGKMIENVTGLSREGGMKYRSVSAFWNSKEENTWINVDMEKQTS